MFWGKNKKNRYTPAYSHFYYIKVGFKGVFNTQTCFPDELSQGQSLRKVRLPLTNLTRNGQGGKLLISNPVLLQNIFQAQHEISIAHKC